MEKSDRFESMDATMSAFVGKRGPPRKLTLEQELLLVMMRLRLALCVGDLAFRFLRFQIVWLAPYSAPGLS